MARAPIFSVSMGPEGGPAPRAPPGRLCIGRGSNASETGTCEVDAQPPNGFGIFGLSGNVQEITASRCDGESDMKCERTGTSGTRVILWGVGFHRRSAQVFPIDFNRVRLSWNAAFSHHFTRRRRGLTLGMGDGGALAA